MLWLGVEVDVAHALSMIALAGASIVITFELRCSCALPLSMRQSKRVAFTPGHTNAAAAGLVIAHAHREPGSFAGARIGPCLRAIAKQWNHQRIL